MSKPSKTFSTSYRGEVIDVAVIARWFINQGIIPRSRNELVNAGVKNFAELIVKKYPELAVTSTEDACLLFEQLGLVGKNRASVLPTEKLNNWEAEELEIGAMSELEFEQELSNKATAANTSQVASQLENLAAILDRRRKQDQSISEALASTNGLPIEE